MTLPQNSYQHVYEWYRRKYKNTLLGFLTRSELLVLMGPQATIDSAKAKIDSVLQPLTAIEGDKISGDSESNR